MGTSARPASTAFIANLEIDLDLFVYGYEYGIARERTSVAPHRTVTGPCGQRWLSLPAPGIDYRSIMLRLMTIIKL